MDEGGIMRISLLLTALVAIHHGTFFILCTQTNKHNWKRVGLGQEDK